MNTATTDVEQLNDGTLTRPALPSIPRQPRTAVKRWTLRVVGAPHITAETQDAREGSMSSELTQEQVSTLVARGWWYTDAYIGGRGYVQRVTDGTHVYEQGGVNYWWRVR